MTSRMIIAYLVLAVKHYPQLKLKLVEIYDTDQTSGIMSCRGYENEAENDNIAGLIQLWYQN